jgi:radical SAM protein with 4Fe4S-binding SPASM domain
MSNQDTPFIFGELEVGNYIWLTLTNLCNIHCKYCFNYVLNNNQAMSHELATSIIKSHLQALDENQSDFFNIIYFGGEPTLNQKALLSCIDFFIENDINCRQCIMTNGIFKQSLFNNLINKDIDFQISFDGAGSNLRYNKNQKRLIYDETVEGIEKLCLAGESVKVRATIHKDNTNNIPSLVEFCANLGVSKLMCSPICDFGDSNKNKVRQPDVNEYVDNMLIANELSHQLGVKFEIKGEQYLSNLKSQKLNVPFVWLPDGYVAMTITYASSKAKGAEKIIIGHYDESQHKIILNKQTIAQMKTNFEKNYKIHCSECPLKESCRGALHFTPFATDTFIYERDNYFCQIALKMTQEFPS